MNGFYLKLFLPALFLISTLSPLMAQRSNGLAVEGTVSVEEGSVENAVIEMYRDGKRIDNYGIGNDGRYKVELNYNHEFILIFTREDNFPQKIVVNTNVPRNVLQSDPKFPSYPVDIHLFTEIPGIDRTFSENTVLKIYYSKDVDNFISDVYYNNAQIKHMIDQAIAQSQMIDREADYLATLTKEEREALRKEYDQLIDQAEKEYNNEEFLAALDGYQAASKIFPKEQYPKDRIAEINDLLGLVMVADEMEKALAGRLETLLKQGDAQFEQKAFEEARNSYQRVLSIDSENTHARDRLTEITALLQQQQIDKEYQNLIAAADNAFGEMFYDKAKNSYQQALELKRNEEYPQQKIDEIDEILDNQASRADKLKNYEESVFQAELNFEKQFYEKAISFYEKALNFKPGDELAARKIREIKDLMNELANRTLYDELIKTADKAFKKENFPEALADYEQAVDLFPEEDWPNEQISRINEILEEEQNFVRLIREADVAFEEQEYLQSRNLYRKALEIESEDDHALSRIDEIDQIFAQQALNERYQEIVDEADQLAENNEMSAAVDKFREALDVKPDEPYPQERIDEIAGLLEQLAAAQKAYDDAIARADRHFESEAFDEATTGYTEAQDARPDESYPGEMLARIDSITQARARLAAEEEAAEQARLAELQAEKDRQYNRAVAVGDSLFNLEEYDPSRTAYEQALDVKPDEPYPQERIDEITQVLLEQEKLEQDYQNRIKLADQQFINENFEKSIASYQEALTIKPEENYPQEKIADAGRILKQQELEEEYQSVILAADAFFRDESYLDAKRKYEEALELKPGENYPKGQIIKVDNRLKQQEESAMAEQQAAADMERRQAEVEQQQEDVREREITSEAGLNQLYNDYLLKADESFDSENYNVARAWYYKARDVKPEEPYPPRRIEEINRIVNSLLLNQRDRDYQRFVDLADSTFRENQLAVARGWYNRALSVKAGERYPKDQLEEIRVRIEERMAGRSGELFEDYMNKADNAFDLESYNVARFWYKKALELRPDDGQAKGKLEEIREVFNQ